MNKLSEPEPAALALIADCNLPIVEIGAGDGCWAQAIRALGITVHAFDPRGNEELVKIGTHLDAAEYFGALLIVWPPDGLLIQEWIRAANWPIIFICGNFLRFDVGATLDGYKLDIAIGISAGRKGRSTFRVYK